MRCPHVWERNNYISNFNPALYQRRLLRVPVVRRLLGGQPWPANRQWTSFYLNGIALAGQNGTPRGLSTTSGRPISPASFLL